MCRADFRCPCRDGLRNSGNALNGSEPNYLNDLSAIEAKDLTQRRKECQGAKGEHSFNGARVVSTRSGAVLGNRTARVQSVLLRFGTNRTPNENRPLLCVLAALRLLLARQRSCVEN